MAQINRLLMSSVSGPIMLQMPTGAGKTVMAAALAEQWAGQRIIFTVPAVWLVDQTLQRFYAEGIHDVGVIQANHHLTNYARSVQIASVQTLMRRPIIPRADLVIIDEAHRWFDFYDEWFARPQWRDVPIIGMSATPWTRGLGTFYKSLVIGATTTELIEEKYLSPFRVFAPASPDLTGVRTVAGDYHEGDLAAAVNKTDLVANVIETWMARGQGRSTLCFAVDRVHAKHLQMQFAQAGVAAGYVDAFTPPHERREIERDFRAGTIKVVCNVGVLTTGVDWDVRCIILARPTKSEILFVQMIGRGLRTAPGKTDCLILDHSDTHSRLGFVTDIHHEQLDDGKTRAKPDVKDKAALPKKCPKCTFLKPPKVHACPACGFKPEPKTDVRNRDGELVELAARNIAVKQDQQKFYRELKAYAFRRGHKLGWVGHTFREKFGFWPNGLEHLSAIDPSAETLGWIRSRMVAYAKSAGRSAWR